MKLINILIISFAMFLLSEGCSKKSPPVPPAPVKPATVPASPIQPKMATSTAPSTTLHPATAPDVSRPAASVTPAMATSFGMETSENGAKKPALAMTEGVNSTTLPANSIKSPGVLPVYSYNAEGRKDPFATFLQGTNSKRTIKTSIPLLNYSLSDLKLVAVMIIKKHQFLAMVQTPDSKGYVVKPGMEIGINRGRVHEITDHSISVEEEFTEIGGEKKKRTIVLSLHPPEEGQL
ncbi:MAG: pilus assembly protein PilP [Nitrospirae bacterium]|nr:pilus assembly protein PilP [Nitrospirota bacterium]